MIPTAHFLIVGGLIFALGLGVVLMRRQILLVLMGIELMLNGVNLTFAAFSRAHGELDGQMVALFLLIVTAAEVAVALALLLQVVRRLKISRVEQLNADDE